MQVRVQTLEGMEYTIDGVDTAQTVDKLKYKIKAATSIQPDEQTLIYLGQTLEGGILKDYDVVEGCKINMTVRSVGGRRVGDGI